MNEGSEMTCFVCNKRIAERTPYYRRKDNSLAVHMAVGGGACFNRLTDDAAARVMTEADYTFNPGEDLQT